MSAWVNPAAGLFLCAVVLMAQFDGHVASTNKDVWAEKWCELNDCYGVRAAEQREGAVAKVEKEHRKVTRRYLTTGEVKAINSELVQSAWFGYDGPVLDHPAFPGVAAEHSERAERRNEENAIGIRQIVEKRAISPPQPGGGYLLPQSDEASKLAVRELDDGPVGVARRRYSILKNELRMDCMYGINQEKYNDQGGFKYGQGITSVPKAPKGCAAGSVWHDNGRGGVKLVSRTAESGGSVWRKVNGTDREWWQDVEPPPKDGRPWVDSWKQVRSRELLPYKMGAPPPCTPGYGGAFCKKELGTGGDYVDEEDEPPPWAQMADVKRLKQFWREQYALSTGKTLPGVNMRKHAANTALPLATGEYSAGTADRSKDDAPDDAQACSCDPLDFKCILQCTQKAMIAPTKCYEKCDDTMCHQECVHVELSFEKAKAAGVGSKQAPKDTKDKTATQALGAGQESLRIAAQPDSPSPPHSPASDNTGTERESSSSSSSSSNNSSSSSNNSSKSNTAAAGLDLCEPGSFSVTGQKPCGECAEGSYMPNAGARSCVRCAQGSFQNMTGATACDSCEGGEAATTAGAGATSSRDCGRFPAVTGIQFMRYEQHAGESTTLTGHTAVEEDEWKPTLYGGALGPWYGGWWIAVYGKNLGKDAKELEEIRVGDLACRKSVWLSATSSACMVPRGMGWGLPVTVGLVGGKQASVENKFSYEAPVVDSYHPRNGPPRGGFWITITGRNFGHLDTSPVVSLAGHICLESYWMSDSKIMCRGPPGVGGPSMLHHVDITFEPTEHIQEMPRRLRGWVRTLLHTTTRTVSAKQNASKPLVEIDVKAAYDGGGSSALVAKGDKMPPKSDSAGGKGVKRSAASIVERKKEWEEQEREVKAALSERKASAKDVELDLLASYLERVEDRDKAREDQEKAERERKRAEYQAVLDAERKIREEEEAAAKARQEHAALRQALEKGTVERKLDKFTKAREAARKAKVAKEAQAALAATQSCTDLVQVDCKAGNCKLLTAPALASPQCVRSALEHAANLTEAAGLLGGADGMLGSGKVEAAKKVVALLFEMRVGLEAGDRALKAAESAVAALNGREDIVKEEELTAGREAMGKARAAFEAVGVFGRDGLQAVEVLEIKARQLAADAARRVEMEREKHRADAEGAVSKARVNVKEGNFAEARAAHGNARVEYEMAGLKETMASELDALLAEISRAEDVAKAREADEAEVKRRDREEAEKKEAVARERQRVEEEARVAAEERVRVAEMERKIDEEEQARKEAEAKQKAAQQAERERREREQRAKEEAEAAALVAAQAKLAEEGASDGVGNSSDVCSSAGGGEKSSCASANANSSARQAAEAQGTKHNAQEEQRQKDAAVGAERAAAKKKEEEVKAAAAKTKQEEDKAAAARAAAEQAAEKAAAATPATAATTASVAGGGGAGAETTAAEKAAAEGAAAAAAAAAASADKGNPEKRAGVGVAVKPVVGADKIQTGLQVSKLVNGGAAAMSGSVDEGDFLEAVDGVDVRTWPLKKLANEMILGKPGSKVILTLKSRVSGTSKTVELVRG